MPQKKPKNHIIKCIYQREFGLCSKLGHDLLKSFVEEKASLPNKNQPCEISGQTRATLLMEFSADGKRIASTHGDHSIRVTDIRTGKCTHTLNGHPRTPWCIAFHPSNNDILGSGCLGGEVRIWDLQGGGSEVWHCDDALSIASMTFHPSDNVVVFAISNKLHFWDWTRPEPFAVCMTAHEFEKIRWVKFDRIGDRLLTAIANASDEALSDGLRFSLFNERSAEENRYTHNGTIDVTQLHSGSSGLYQAHRMSMNDDSLMDLRTQWSENRNTLEQARRLSNAQRYAHNVTNQAYRSSLGSRLMFESDSNLSPPADHEGIIDRQRNAAQSSSDSYNFDLSARSGPLLLTTSQSSALPANNWLSMSHERELEAGDALLSLAADGRQTPSRYIHGLSGDGAQQRFLSGDDPLSENLTLLEPGYVEVTPSTSSYEDSSERTIAASSPVALETDELSSVAMLDQLLRQDGNESNQQGDLSRDVFQSAHLPSEDTLLSGVGTNSVMSTEPTFARAERDAGHSVDCLADIWLNSSGNWDVEQSSSSASTSHQHLPETGRGTQDALATTSESDLGLDLRLRCPESDARDVSEHCYAMPASSSAHPSPTFDEIEVSLQLENNSADASAISQSPAAGNWLDDPCLNLTSLQSRTRLSNDDSPQPPSDGMTSRTIEARTNDGSSARCRIFPPRADSASSSLSAAASATVTSAAAAASSFSSFRVRQEMRNQDSRAFFDNLRRTRRNHCHSVLRSNGHTLDCSARNSDTGSSGCAVCSGMNLAQMFNSNDPQPSTSQGRASIDNQQVGRSLTDEEFPVSNFFQLPDVASVQPESSNPVGREPITGRLSGSNRMSFLSRPRLFRSTDSFSNHDVPNNQSHLIPRIEIFSDDLDERVQSADEHGSPTQHDLNERMRYLEPVIYRPMRFGSSRFATMSERLRERRERINFHVEELRARFGSSSSAAGYLASGGTGTDAGRGAGPVDDELFAYRGAGSPGFGSGADAVGDSIGNEDREHIVSRLRGFREEMRALRQDRFARSYRYYMPNRSLRSGRDSVFSGEDIQSLRVNAALNRAISGALAANGESSVGSNIGDPTFRIQAWNFVRCHIPDISDSESNILVRRAKIHNDANVDISQDGRFICTFTLPTRSFSGDIMLSVFSLMPENFGECLFTKNFGPNAISVSLSPCNNYVLVGLATKRFTWMFTPKQMVAQVYRLKIPRADEDSMEHVCDITHPCDTDFRAPISMNSARWLLGPGEGLAYGTNRGDLNICRPGFEQIEKPEVNDNLSESVPIRRNLMQMLGIAVPRMMNSATQTSHSLRRSASTQTDQNSQSSSSSSLASTSSSAVATSDGNSRAANMDTGDMNL